MPVFPQVDADAMIAEFGEPVLIDGSPFHAVVDDAYVGDFGIAGSNPVATITGQAADSISVNQSFIRESNSKEYIVREIKPDGDGFFLLTLEEQ